MVLTPELLESAEWRGRIAILAFRDGIQMAVLIWEAELDPEGGLWFWSYSELA